MPGTDALSIGEVARRVGLRPSAIRYYEQIGLAAAPRRAGGQRRYAPSEIARLQLIHRAQQQGFTLREIRQLLDAHPGGTPSAPRWQALARTKLPQVEQVIARATRLKALLEAGSQCACADLEQCFGVPAETTTATGTCSPDCTPR